MFLSKYPSGPGTIFQEDWFNRDPIKLPLADISLQVDQATSLGHCFQSEPVSIVLANLGASCCTQYEETPGQDWSPMVSPITVPSLRKMKPHCSQFGLSDSTSQRRTELLVVILATTARACTAPLNLWQRISFLCKKFQLRLPLASHVCDS